MTPKVEIYGWDNCVPDNRPIYAIRHTDGLLGGLLYSGNNAKVEAEEALALHPISIYDIDEHDIWCAVDATHNEHAIQIGACSMVILNSGINLYVKESYAHLKGFI